MGETATNRGRPQHGRRLAKRALLTILGSAAGWLALILHPQPLFAYSAQRANVVLYTRAPMPPQAGPLLDEVVRRISRSPLYDVHRVHHVFLCDTRALFGFFTVDNYRAGGVSHAQLGGNVFIRPFSIERGTVIGPSGQEKTGERTLTYYVAHEVTHAMTADRTGRWGFHQLSAFQREGYADYVGFGRPLDLGRERQALIDDAPEMSTRRSGLYKRYELLVAYLLERRGLTVDDLLARRIEQREIEGELLSDTRL
ncbi:MAG TPA: hypothetical protein VLC06_05240 [Polyangia bacterium]|jgi:hypothetical protein|nr:hypothetical protein [Polyangia bacterium]